MLGQSFVIVVVSGYNHRRLGSCDIGMGRGFEEMPIVAMFIHENKRIASKRNLSIKMQCNYEGKIYHKNTNNLSH